jgi:hypothetical protein
MPRPKGWLPYRLADGTEVPSVTHILGKFRDPGPLMWWSWNEGKAGRDYRTTRNAAADAGTLAHSMVEADIHGRPFALPADLDPMVQRRAETAFKAYQTWKTQTRLVPADPETRLVSEKYRFGGTIDSMLIGGQRAICDLKTSQSVYTEHLIQVAAYGLLWDETHPDEVLHGGYHILRISRETADFAHYYFGELEEAARSFLLMRELFDLDRRLKLRVA